MVAKKSKSPYYDSRILVKDFKKLRVCDYEGQYPGVVQKEFEKLLAVFQPNGSIIINRRNAYCDLMKNVLSLLTQQTASTLKEAEELYQAKYPDVNSIDEITKYEGDNLACVEIVARFVIPIEFKRREIERQYYNKIKPFR